MARHVPRRVLAGVATTALLATAALSGPVSTAFATASVQPAHIVCAAGTSSVIVGCCPTPPPCPLLPASTTPSKSQSICVRPLVVMACPLASSSAESGPAEPALAVRCCPGPVVA